MGSVLLLCCFLVLRRIKDWDPHEIIGFHPQNSYHSDQRFFSSTYITNLRIYGQFFHIQPAEDYDTSKLEEQVMFLGPIIPYSIPCSTSTSAFSYHIMIIFSNSTIILTTLVSTVVFRHILYLASLKYKLNQPCAF